MAEQNNQNRAHRRKEDSPFRRKEDELRYNILERIMSAFKWLVVLNIVVLYFFYNTITSQNNTDTFQIKLLNDLSEKIDKSNKIIPKDYISIINPTPSKCLTCHIQNKNDIIIRQNWGLREFKDYIRGNYRIPENKSMPHFTDNEVSDKEIEDIFIYLKMDKQINQNPNQTTQK